MEEYKRSQRTTLKRLPDRAVYEYVAIRQILDEGFICHVGFVVDRRPFVIPTSYARVEDTLFIHGSVASRMLRNLAQGVDVCVTVTLIDGLVLARSAFNHSMNYRSVIIFGNAEVVPDGEEKLKALRALSDHIIPLRWDDVRRPSQNELKQTLVLSLALKEVSAKVRSGPPIDGDDDYELPVWAGVLPMRIVAEDPISDPRLSSGITVPSYLKNYRRGVRLR
jgi:nitroimidazol reductase NimA-like FMN-containing flavoprotein (pyridoxamine 5'-phosphate oxidase superfamily)